MSSIYRDDVDIVSLHEFQYLQFRYIQQLYEPKYRFQSFTPTVFRRSPINVHASLTVPKILVTLNALTFSEREHCSNRFNGCYLPSKLSYFSTYFILYCFIVYCVLRLDVLSCVSMVFSLMTTKLK